MIIIYLTLWGGDSVSGRWWLPNSLLEDTEIRCGSRGTGYYQHPLYLISEQQPTLLILLVSPQTAMRQTILFLFVRYAKDYHTFDCY
jgi:hypothetical protein